MRFTHLYKIIFKNPKNPKTNYDPFFKNAFWRPKNDTPPFGGSKRRSFGEFPRAEIKASYSLGRNQNYLFLGCKLKLLIPGSPQITYST